jgi:hypothetical protein
VDLPHRSVLHEKRDWGRHSKARLPMMKIKSRGPFLTSPLGSNFDPQGRSCPQGVHFVPWGRGWSYPLGCEILCTPLHSSKQSREGVNIPLGEISPEGHGWSLEWPSVVTTCVQPQRRRFGDPSPLRSTPGANTTAFEFATTKPALNVVGQSVFISEKNKF